MSRSPLKIAVISQYFHPENFIINDIVRELQSQGHQLEVFTGKPNYPTGRFSEGYQAQGYQLEDFAGAPVHRAPLRARQRGGAKHLLLNYLSFVWNGLRVFPPLARKSRFDVYFVFAPSPITSVIPALGMKAFHRAPVFLWVQDLWPESLEATGFIRNKLMLRSIGVMVRLLYKAVDVVMVQSKGFVEPVSRYVRADKIVYYPNSYLQDHPDDNPVALPESLTCLLRQRFCVVFAGNLGTAQALPTIVEAARLLHAEGSEARIVLVGDGSKAKWLAEQKVALQLDNLVLAGPFARSAMAELFELSSVLLVTLKRDEIFSYTIPSKVQAYLAAGKPIIASLDGEGARVVDAAGAGMTSSAEDASALASCIRSMQILPDDERQRMGQNGKAYYLKHYELKTQCKKLIELFEQQCSGDRV